MAFLVSGFVADAFTGVAHFGFDYVLRYSLPVLGPVAFEFNQHHDEPSLDPSSYGPNLTKGSYVSIPLSILLLMLVRVAPETYFWFWVEATFMGITAWAFFFHQIHAYAHMGSSLPPDVFKGRVEEIARLENQTRAKACPSQAVRDCSDTATHQALAALRLDPEPGEAQHSPHTF